MIKKFVYYTAQDINPHCFIYLNSEKPQEKYKIKKFKILNICRFKLKKTYLGGIIFALSMIINIKVTLIFL